jgi:hypothetical protein
MSSNVIDFMSHLEKKKKPVTGEIVEREVTPVFDMTEKRQAELEEDRRQVKRTILTEFVGTHLVVPGAGLQKVVLHDVAESGISFDLDQRFGRFNVGEEVVIRLYLNKDTYFPFHVTVANCRFVDSEGAFRHGCEIAHGSVNDEALQHFIMFIETVSASLRKDGGDVLVGNLST